MPELTSPRIRASAGTAASAAALEQASADDRKRVPGSADAPGAGKRIGLIRNARSHLNSASRPQPAASSGDHLLVREPDSREELARTLLEFRRSGIDLLLIDGGDGTVSDVLTCAIPLFGSALPPVSIIPSGKTNGLALDLGIRRGFSTTEAVELAGTGSIIRKCGIEVHRVHSDEPPLYGFLFGAGAFVHATALAQRAHRLGAFHGVAVGLSLLGAVLRTLFDRRRGRWRSGERMRIGTGGAAGPEADHYLFMATTLTRFPLGMRPFGRAYGRFKTLAIDAPPRRIFRSVPALLRGSEAPALAAAGYHRAHDEPVRLSLAGDFILDGERHEGGELMIRQGPPIDFLVPAEATLPLRRR